MPSFSPRKPSPGDLLDAVSSNDLARVRNLIDQGAEINERDIRGNTPLGRALSYNYIEIARVLLEKGADVNAANKEGYTPLMLAVSSYAASRDAMVSLVLSHGAKTELRNSYGETAHDIATSKARPITASLIKEEESRRKRLAEEFARAAREKREAETAEKLKRVKDAAKNRPKPGPKPPKAA
jgi:ankyrin repeat protein